MSDSTLYESCLRKVLINLRNGIYIPTTTYPKNQFNAVAPKFVNAIMFAALDRQRANGLRAEDLKPLLISGQLQELKIDHINAPDFTSQVQIIIQILVYLQSGCDNLKTLHLLVPEHDQDVLICEIRRALGILLETTSNLEDLDCCFNFDLKALINCKKLRSLNLHFSPRQRWYEFLGEEGWNFQKHECLELFNICRRHVTSEETPYDDVAIILQHCPKLTSLGLIESSGLLSRNGISTPDLKLRHCFFEETYLLDNATNRVEKAISNYRAIEELDFNRCRIRSLPYLINLSYLVYLNITLDSSVTSDAFDDALKAIGPQLRHLSFNTPSPMDISVHLQNCLNLESLRILEGNFAEFVNSSVSLPNLQRLNLNPMRDYSGRGIGLFCGCDQLTEMYVTDAFCFDDEALHLFLERNSPSKLKVVYVNMSTLTDHGFRELLLKAPQLEKVEIFTFDFSIDNFISVISETNRTELMFNEGDSLLEDEFFEKRRKEYRC